MLLCVNRINKELTITTFFVTYINKTSFPQSDQKDLPVVSLKKTEVPCMIVTALMSRDGNSTFVGVYYIFTYLYQHRVILK